MNVITHSEAEQMYEQRRLFVSDKKIAAEFGKAERSVQRAIGLIAHERGTYSYPRWRRKVREYKQASAHWFFGACSERDRKAKLAAQSAEEHLAMVELTTRTALGDRLPREARAERERRAESLYGAPIRVSDGDKMGELGGRAPLPLSPAERQARRRAKRLHDMLGPNPMPHELGLE